MSSDGPNRTPPEFSGLLVLWLVSLGFAGLAIYGASWVLALLALVGIGIAGRWSFVKWRELHPDR